MVALDLSAEPPPTAPTLAKCYMPPPTADAVIAMYEAMIGKAMTDEAKIALRAKLAALEARKARDRASSSPASPASATHVIYGDESRLDWSTSASARPRRFAAARRA